MLTAWLRAAELDEAFERGRGFDYDPEELRAALPDLRAAHAEVDALVDSIYSKHGYETDKQRLADLFAMYEEMI